jgi:hypothetical protein
MQLPFITLQRRFHLVAIQAARMLQYRHHFRPRSQTVRMTIRIGVNVPGGAKEEQRGGRGGKDQHGKEWIQSATFDFWHGDHLQNSISLRWADVSRIFGYFQSMPPDFTPIEATRQIQMEDG